MPDYFLLLKHGSIYACPWVPTQKQEGFVREEKFLPVLELSSEHGDVNRIIESQNGMG